MSHSLSDAVADGTISEQAARCGLNVDDVRVIATKHPALELLVRFRSACGDARAVVPAGELEAWRRMQMPRLVDGRWWSYNDIRDVMALARPA